MIEHATIQSVQTVQKEQIKFLHFPHEDVLVNKQDKDDRYLALKRAMSLGNLEQGKVKIVFADDESIKKVETTVWAVTFEAVILKQAMIIPLERIISVN